MRLKVISFLVTGACIAAGCGGHSPAAPTSPSTSVSTPAPPAPTPGVTTGATISGTVVGVSSASRLRTLATGLTVSVTGSSSGSIVDDTGHFTLRNVPAGHVELHFVGPGIDARLPLDDVSANATIVITVRVSGSSAEIDDDEREDANHDAEVEGTVSAINGGTLTIGSKSVTIGASTVIVHGDTTLTAKDIHVGDRVHVHGTVAGSTIAATRIEVEHGAETPGAGDDDNDHGGDHGGTETELQGTISGRAGACPAITFTVSSTKVVTSGSTEFKDTACSALANGDRVEVKGTRQGDGSVSASRVEKEK